MIKGKNLFKAIVLLVTSVYSFADGVILDPNSKQNTKLDKAQNGTPIVNISTPNNRGISVNEFLDYNIDSHGQILNNADNTGRSHLGGLINANPNLGPNQAAGLIVLQVNGANKSKIEGYLEALSRKKVDVILSNENGIYFNNSGTINIRKFTATTGKIKLKDGDYIGIDVKRGNIAIGEKGLDLTNADYVEILSKTLEIAGNVVAKDEIKIIAGTNEMSKDGKITKNNSASPAEVAIDASALGGMYANTVKIISTEKGAGVNSSSFIISKDKELEITVDGKVKINKVQGNGVKVEAREFEQKELTHSTKNIDIKAKNIKTSGITQAEKEINLDGDVENTGTIYTKKYLNTKALKNSGNIQAQKEIKIDGKLINSGDIQTQNELVIDGSTDNKGIIEAQDRIKIAENLDNSGNIYTNNKLSAKNVKNSKDIVAIKDINIKKLENSGEVLTDNKLTINGELLNSGKIQSVKEITIDGDINNDGVILSDSTLTAKNTKNTKDIIIKEKIDILNTENSGTVATLSTLNISGNLKNTGIVSANKEIQVQEDIENDGKILTDSSLKAKDIVNKKDIIGLGNINVDNVNNSGSIVSEGSLNINGKLENTNDIQAKGNINVKDNLKNSGEIKSLKSLEAQNIKNINKILVNENVTTNNLENTGILGVGERLLANESLSNTKTIEATNIEVKNKFLENKGDIKTEIILADTLNVKNDGNILAIDDIKINTSKFENNKNIESLNDILINSKLFSNSGKIASNNKIDVNNPKFENSGEILSNYINLNDLEEFKNSGSIKGTDVKIFTFSDIDLIGTLHGENNLLITGKNIINNGKTSGNGDFFLNTENFTNNKDLLFKNININSKGDIENNSVINGDVISISSNNFVNNDLIAALNNANIISKEKITNNEGKSIFAGNNLNIQAKEMLNSKGELLGKNISITADYLKNDIGLIQAENDIHISSLKFENIGESLDLDRYESYYVTWDGQIIEESEIGNWKRHISRSSSKRSNGHAGHTISRRQKRAFEEIISLMERDKYPSLLFPKYTELMRGYLGNNGEYREKARSTRIQDPPLLEKVRSLGKTNYAKVQAGNNILIDSKTGNVEEVINKDAIISAGNNVEIKADKISNITSVGEKVKVKTGEESMYIMRERYGKKHRKKVKMEVTYNRGFGNDYITKKVKKLDENGKPVMRKRFGRLRPVYEYVTEYIGRYAYVTGKPSIIEGKNIIIDNSKIVKQGIEEANGNINSGRIENSLIDKAFDITTGTSSTNQNLNFDKKLNNKDTLDELARTEVVSNTKDIENIIKTGKIDILPDVPSALFIKNVSPDAKYVLESRINYISIGHYYGSDYFLSRIGYEEKWDRVKRLGDAYYENSLIDKNISDKLGTRFLNGEIVSMKNLIDNAKDESIKLGLKIGEPLSTKQKENLSKDIVWYELGEFSGEKVLIPKVYLSKKTLSTINGDSRTKIIGTNLVNIQSSELYNSGLIGSNGTTFVKGNNIFNRTLTNQIGEIKGNKTTLIAEKNIENIGGKLLGKEELTLISKDGDILNSSTTVEFNQNFGEVNRSEYSQIKDVGEISSEGKLDIAANNYTSIASKTNAKDLNIVAKEAVNISSQEVSGEQKFGKDGNNFVAYEFTKNIGSNVEAENINVIAKNVDIKGSDVVAEKDLDILAKENINLIATNNSEYNEKQSREKKGFGRKKSSVDISYATKHTATNLTGDNVRLESGKDVVVLGSNIGSSENGEISIKTDGNIIQAGVKDTDYHYSKTSKTGIFGLSKKSKETKEYKEKAILSTTASGDNGVLYDSKNNLILEGVNVISSGEIILKGNEVAILPTQETSVSETIETKRSIGGKGFSLVNGKAKLNKEENLTNIQSEIVGNNVNILADKNINIVAVNISAKNDINLKAKEDVNILATDDVNASKSAEHKYSIKPFASINGLKLEAGIKANNSKTKEDNFSTTVKGSQLIADNNINIISGKDTTIEASKLTSNKTEINTGGEINILTRNEVSNTTLKTENSETKVALKIDLSGIKDTLKSVKDVVVGVKDLPKAGKFAMNLTKGKSLDESLAGNEKGVEEVSRIFKGPSSGGVSAGVFASLNVEKMKQNSESSHAIGSELISNDKINLNSNKNTNIEGSLIKANEISIISKQDVNIRSGKSTSKSKESSESLGGELNILTGGVGANVGYNKNRTESLTNNNSLVEGDKITIATNDLTIKGGNVVGNKVDISAKNLTIESVQDIEKRKGQGFNISGGVTGNGSTSKNVGIGVNKSDYVKEWVNNQSSIIGKEKSDITVEDTTKVVGAVIGGEDTTLKTGKLEYSNIYDKEKGRGVGVNTSIGISTQNVYNEKEPNNPDKETKITHSDSISYDSINREQINRATIGKGKIIVDGKETTPDINRDESKSQEITKDVVVDNFTVNYDSNAREWNEVRKIMIEHGAELDNGFKIIYDKLGLNYKYNMSKDFENIWNEIELVVGKDLKQDFIGLIPTERNYGGIFEQPFSEKNADATFSEIEIKNSEIIKNTDEGLSVEAIIKNIEDKFGNLKDVSSIDFGNGILNFKDGIPISSGNQTLKPKDLKILATNPHESIKIKVYYNPSHGVIGDLIECTQDLIGVYTGGFIASANAKKLAKNIEKNPIIIKNYTAHSQGSLILANALMLLEKKGKTDILKGAKIHMNGSPINMEFMKEFAIKYQIEFSYKANKNDPITYIGNNKSNTTNYGHTGEGNDVTKGYNKYQEFNSETKKYEISVGSERDKIEKKVKYTTDDIYLINESILKGEN